MRRFYFTQVMRIFVVKRAIQEEILLHAGYFTSALNHYFTNTPKSPLGILFFATSLRLAFRINIAQTTDHTQV
jgi:hypothetical protein